MAKSMRIRDSAEVREYRFWKKVDRSGGYDACWPWTGYIAPNGYGTRSSHRRETRLAHRIAYQYMVSPIPAGLVLDHLCHTRDPQCADVNACLHRRCCNPAHLEPVTARENIARGRGGDSWGYVHEPLPVQQAQLVLAICVNGCSKPLYKRGHCRPCYRKWLKDPDVERPSQRTREQRFWQKVKKNGPVPEHKPELGGCWLWTAGINRGTGYGMFGVRHGEMMDAHRFSYLLANGSIPEKHDVHHLCHTRHCVRPDHLEALTRSQNLAERKNRRAA